MKPEAPHPPKQILSYQKQSPAFIQRNPTGESLNKVSVSGVISSGWLLAKQLEILIPEKGVCNIREKSTGRLSLLVWEQILDS